MALFEKILIANRGEIACRIIRTARRLGIATVAVYSDADACALHVKEADEAVRIGAPASRESYLKGDAIIEAAQKTGAQAIHPGYGFLSENEDFAAACCKAGIVFIGPSPESIRAMGLKDKAKDIMEKAGVPVVPGYKGEKQDIKTLQEAADKTGYPVLIKAVAGGGGKGMRLVERREDFAAALESCKREAKSSFANDHVLIEKYIIRPRHVEIQVFGDSHGNAVHLFERDCSLQRRHQKVVEEAPAPGLPEKVRQEMGASAVKAIRALRYTNAGTIEFIMDSRTYDFYFMEMNTRIQVEHPVTEMITGVDLIEWQLRVAAGEMLPLTQEKIAANGHAFEARLYAEDPANNFLPQAGRVARFRPAPQARTDTGIAGGDAITIHYDPMIAKIIVSGRNRDEALRALREALSQTILSGPVTNQEFLANIAAHKDFAAAHLDTGFIARHEKELLPENYGQPEEVDLICAAVFCLSGAGAESPESPCGDPWGGADSWRLNGYLTRTLTFAAGNTRFEVTAECRGREFVITAGEKEFSVIRESFADDVLKLLVGGVAESAQIVAAGPQVTVFRNGRVLRLGLYNRGGAGAEGVGEGRILAPMPGKIINVMVRRGDAVAQDQPIMIMEAMKMEMTIKAGCAGIVESLAVAVNDQVPEGTTLAEIRADVGSGTKGRKT